MKPTIGQVVMYASRTGVFVAPAIVVATVRSLSSAGVELYERTRKMYEGMDEGSVDSAAQGVPPLSSDLHVHLVVLSPGLPGNIGLPFPADANEGGTFREWDIPFDGEFAPGTWAWPALS